MDAFGVWDTAPTTIHQRWPGLSEAELNHKARTCGWVLRENATLRWYDPDKPQRKLLWRSKAFNQRNQHGTRSNVKKEILENGLVKEACGEPIAKPESVNDLEHTCKEMLAAGHRAEAFYELDDDPVTHNQPNVVATRMIGMQGVTILDPRIPPDGERHFVQISNKMNHFQAGRVSWIERAKLIPMITTAFRDHREKKRTQQNDNDDGGSGEDTGMGNGDDGGGKQPPTKKRKTGKEGVDYETEFYEFIKRQLRMEEQFPHFLDFKLLRGVWNKLHKRGIWENFEDMVNLRADFANVAMQDSEMVHVWSDIILKLGDACPDDIMIDVLSLSFPHRDFLRNATPPFPQEPQDP